VGSQSGVPGSPSPPDDIATVAARRRAGRQLLRSDCEVPDRAARRPGGGGGIGVKFEHPEELATPYGSSEVHQVRTMACQ